MYEDEVLQTLKLTPAEPQQTTRTKHTFRIITVVISKGRGIVAMIVLGNDPDEMKQCQTFCFLL